ncbi:MAG: hypothetical protein Q8K26_03950 [Candidatus Gracilibacteria bacterium]|nr:hypothetical protein [Candidatus Gracilibacteria bacterium]
MEFSWGTTEVKVGKTCDAIVDLTETGKSLEANNLIIYDTILTSSVNFAYNKNIEENSWKKDKISDIYNLLCGVIEGDSKCLIKMNVGQENLEKIKQLLPSQKMPTIMNLCISGWYSLESVVGSADIKYLVPQLKKYGAMDIITSKIDIIVP